MEHYRHVPVLLEAIIAHLSPVDGPFLDLTLGGGGYAEALLSSYVGDRAYYALDRDPDAVERSRRRLSVYGERLHIDQGNFTDIDEIFKGIKGEVSNLFIDLGLSSDQLEDSGRGFSFRSDGPLDMRMSANSDGGITAADVVNETPRDDLADIIYEYGEERNSRRIAAAIVATRKSEPVMTTGRLAEIVAGVVKRRGRIHPATRTFQALRIYVNRELDNLRIALPKALGMLAEGGRLFVVSYHSLEDRIVKRFIKEKANEGEVENLTRKTPIVPAREEVAGNRRSRSAKLRIAERVKR
ncbi:MAG: 16S rRNA (cytosine(1402)-N(4))-methyltransferase RsmH [bacterium]|nr:16S rRNA (cytosine(1402)-N(4))-methyltransferase RsmH [bacterium]